MDIMALKDWKKRERFFNNAFWINKKDGRIIELEEGFVPQFGLHTGFKLALRSKNWRKLKYPNYMKNNFKTKGEAIKVAIRYMKRN